ncbi:MAG: hypothetical protein ACAI44_28830 [Candidatus Sericytochromatia bacterium]
MSDMLSAFQLAQGNIIIETTMPGPSPPSMNPEHYSALLNMSAILLVVPMSLLALGIAYILFNSPVGAPVYRRMADKAFQKKQYTRAANLYAKLHDLQVLLEGNVYARKAAQCHEFSGNLQEAQIWYEKADDWAKVGQLLMEAGAIERAIEVFRDHDLPSRLAMCYEQLQDHLNAGQIYEFELNNPHKAEVIYKKAVASKDKETSLLGKLMLARVYHRLTRSEEALSTLAEVSREIDSSAQYQEFPDLLDLQQRVRQFINS